MFWLDEGVLKGLWVNELCTVKLEKTLPLRAPVPAVRDSTVEEFGKMKLVDVRVVVLIDVAVLMLVAVLKDTDVATIVPTGELDVSD